MSRFDDHVFSHFEYDYLVVGAGLYGSVMARELSDRGKRVLVAERRSHIGGNAYTAEKEGIIVHKYGPHVFHTDNEEVWEYVNRFAAFSTFLNSPAAVYKGRSYTLPVNMDTFSEMWGVSEADEARRIIESQIREAGLAMREPATLEEQAICMVGTEIYEKLIRGYSEKQWGRRCCELPASIIKRMPVSFDHRASYYNDRYQAIPEGGYTPMIDKMLEGIEVMTGTDYDDPEVRTALDKLAKKVVYSGSIDAYYDYRFGRLEYRSIRFDEEKLEGIKNYQDRAVVNYTDKEIPFTRITEHKYFDSETDADRGYTIITREYPVCHTEENEPLYPLTDDTNLEILKKYHELAEKDGRVHFGGRLGRYRYYDMDDVIAAALADAALLTERNE